MVTVDQIRAARGLLNWSQRELGEKAGLSQVAIANIENGKVQATEGSATAIRQAFEGEGLEFIEGGVRRRPDNIEILRGPEAAMRIMDIVYETLLRAEDKEVLVNGVAFTSASADLREAIARHVRRLQDSGLSERILVAEATSKKDIIGPPEWHRALPSEIFSANTPYLIFGDFFAMVLMDKQETIIIRNASLAGHQRSQFEWLWKLAKPVKD